MSLTDAMWEHARAGRRPQPGNVEGVAVAEAAAFGAAHVERVRGQLVDRLLGAGPLQPLVELADVTDVALNGDGSVWVDRGSGMEQVPGFIDAEAARALAVRLAADAGRRLDDAAPWVDGHLPGGVRLHAVLPPLVSGGAHITLRVPGRTRVDLPSLVTAGTMPPSWLPLLQAVVRERVNLLVSGGTGAGKTTLLGALLSCTPTTERVVVVEDVAELQVEHPHVVRLLARTANVEGVGEVGLTTLVRQALRMRPDRIVLGEARGPEVRELLTAFNTGHDGGCGTLHANSARDVPARVEALAALAGLSPEAARTQLASAVELLLHLRRVDGTRRLESISVLRRDETRVQVVPVATWDGAVAEVHEGADWLRERLGQVGPL